MRSQRMQLSAALMPACLWPQGGTSWSRPSRGSLAVFLSSQMGRHTGACTVVRTAPCAATPPRPSEGVKCHHELIIRPPCLSWAAKAALALLPDMYYTPLCALCCTACVTQAVLQILARTVIVSKSAALQPRVTAV